MNVTKIILTRCQFFPFKMQQIQPDPAGGAHSDHPDPHSWIYEKGKGKGRRERRSKKENRKGKLEDKRRKGSRKGGQYGEGRGKMKK